MRRLDGQKLIKRSQCMARQSSYIAYGCFVPHGSYRKYDVIYDEFHPQGVYADVTPRPGRTYTRATWPPRKRGRGAALDSPRRCEAKLRTIKALQMRRAGYGWPAIARMLGFKDASGPWRAVNRAVTRIEHERMRACH